MAFVLNETKGQLGVSGSITVDLPAHAVDDVVFVYISGLNNNPHTGPGGSWQTISVSDPGGADTVIYYQRVVSAPLTNPTITWTGTTFDCGSLSFVVRGADVSTATSCIDDWDESVSAAALSVTSPALTLTDSNELIILLTGSERRTESAFLGAAQGTELAYYSASDDFSIGLGYTYDQGVSSDTYTAYINHTSTGGIGIYAIAIKDDGGGINRGYAKAGSAADLIYFNVGDHGEAVNGEVDVTDVLFTPQITTITSAQSSVSQTTVNDSFTIGTAIGRLYTEDIGYGQQSNSPEIPDLLIRGIELTSTVDLSSSKICVSAAAEGKNTDTLGNLGRLLGFGDNTNVSLFEYEGSDAQVRTSIGVQTYVIDTSATGYEIDTLGAGSLSWSAVKHIIHGWKPSNYSGPYVYIGALYKLGVMQMLGGSSTLPCSFSDASKAISAGGLNTISDQSGQSGTQFFSLQDISIGDGADDVYWLSQYQSIEFPQAYDYDTGSVQVQADAGAYELLIKVTATSTVDLDTTTINMGNYHKFTLDPTTSTSATYSFRGAIVLNSEVTLNDVGAAITGMTFSGCNEINKNDCDLSGGCSIDSCVETYAVTVATQAEFNDLQNCDFTNNNYSIRITGNHGGATWSATGMTVSGGTGSYDLRYEGSGTLTVEVDSGSGFSQGRAEASVGTLTISAPTVSLTVTSSESSSDIKIFNTTTQTIEASTTGTTISTTTAATYDWTVQKSGFLPQRGIGVVLGASSVTVDVTLVEDLVYSSAHGITFTTDYSYNASTRVMTIVANQEGRNLYSALIDDFISETSLRNCPFPLNAVGPDRIDFAAVGYYNTETTIGATIDSGDVTFWKGAGTQWEHDTTGNPTKKFYSIKSANALQAGSVVGYTQVVTGTPVESILVSDKVNEIIQFFEDTNGDGAPDYDYTGHLLFKGFKTGYYQSRWDVVNDSGITTLEPYEYTINLLQDAIAGSTGDQTITITTLTDHTGAPLVVGGKNFDYELVDPGSSSGENLLSQYNYDVFTAVDTLISGALYTSYQAFDLPDLIIEAGANYETERGYFEGDGAVTDLSGVYLSRSAADHPDISRFESNDGTYYVPVTVAQISAPNVTAGRIQIYNSTAAALSAWQATTAYATGDRVLATTGAGTDLGDGTFFVCTVAGTSGGAEPTWDVAADGNTTVDNTVTWEVRPIEFDNAVTTSGYSNSWTNGEHFTSGDIIRLRWVDEDELEIAATGVATSEGTTSFLNAPVDDTVYDGYAIDGSTVTEYSADYPNIQVDVTDPDNIFYVDRFYAWWKYNLTLEDGIRNFFGAVTASNASNILINNSVVDIYFDNTKASSARQADNIVIQRADGGYPQVTVTSGGGGLGFYYAGVGYTVETGVSGLTAQESTDLSLIGTVDTKIDTIDTNVDAILLDTNELQTDWADAGRLDAILDARATQASIDALNDISTAQVNTEVDTALADYGTSTYDPSVDVLEGSETYQQFNRIQRAALAGKSTVAGSTVTFRDAADTKDRITATTDDDGNRSSVTTDGT